MVSAENCKAGTWVLEYLVIVMNKLFQFLLLCGVHVFQMHSLCVIFNVLLVMLSVSFDAKQVKMNKNHKSFSCHCYVKYNMLVSTRC